MRNLSVCWEQWRKCHSLCHCSLCLGSSSAGHWTDLKREKNLLVRIFFQRYWQNSSPTINPLSMGEYLSLMTRVFRSSIMPQVFPPSSGSPSSSSLVCVFFPAFSADEQSKPERHCPAPWQTAPSSSLDLALAVKIWTAGRKTVHIEFDYPAVMAIASHLLLTGSQAWETHLWHRKWKAAF